MASINTAAFHERFPVNKGMIWLNNCGVTPAGDFVVKAMADFMADYSRNGILAQTADFETLGRDIKGMLAGLLNCDTDEICLIHHTAEGMNLFSHGVGLRPGETVLLLDNEYPSNVYPWRHWAKKGVAIRTLPMGRTPEEFLAAFRNAVDGTTRLVSISAVHWCTGMPLPVAEIGGICRERGILFVVDGAQGVGMRPMDVRADKIDMMAFSAWKWLMGPVGMGALYIRRSLLDAVQPIFVGTDSVVNAREYLPYKDELKPTADRFGVSTPSLNDWVHFRAALAFLAEIGFERVRERLYDLSGFLADRLRAGGWSICSENFPGHPTAIVACEKEGVSSSEMFDKLKANGVGGALRLGRIRLSPHIYNTETQLEKVAALMAEG